MTTTFVMAVGSNWVAHQYPITREDVDQVIRRDATAMAEAGFEALEWPSPHVDHLLDDIDTSHWRDIAAELREAGTPVVSLHGPNLPPLDHDAVDARRMLERHAQMAVATGAHAIVVHPTVHTHPHVCTIVPKLLERDIELCTAISDVLGDSGTKLAVENLPTYGIAYLDELMSKLDQPNIGVCFDTGHWMVRPEGTIEHAVSRFGERIVHLHLSDNNGLCDQHLPPGEGAFDWANFLRALPSTVRNLPMLIELGAPTLLDHDDAANASAAYHAKAAPKARSTLEAAWP